MSLTLDQLRVSLVRKRNHYKEQAQYIEMAIVSKRITVANAVKYNEEAKTLRRVAQDIDDLLYPSD